MSLDLFSHQTFGDIGHDVGDRLAHDAVGKLLEDARTISSMTASETVGIRGRRGEGPAIAPEAAADGLLCRQERREHVGKRRRRAAAQRGTRRHVRQWRRRMTTRLDARCSAGALSRQAASWSQALSSVEPIRRIRGGSRGAGFVDSLLRDSARFANAWSRRSKYRSTSRGRRRCARRVGGAGLVEILPSTVLPRARGAAARSVGGVISLGLARSSLTRPITSCGSNGLASTPSHRTAAARAWSIGSNAPVSSSTGICARRGVILMCCATS